MHHKSKMLLSVFLSWALASYMICLILMAPGYLQSQFALPASFALHANLLGTLGLLFGGIATGLLIDKINYLKTLAYSALAMTITCAGFFWILAEQQWQYLATTSMILGLILGVISSIIPLMLVGNFPAEVRYSGVAFCYNVSFSLCGGLLPLMVIFLLKWHPFVLFSYLALLAAALVAITLTLQKQKNYVHYLYVEQ